MYPVLAGRESTVKAINTALENEKYIFLVTQIDSKQDEPTIKNLYKHGTVARVIQVIKLPNNLIKVLVDGIVQAKVVQYNQSAFLSAQIEYEYPQIEITVEIEALIRQCDKLFQEYINSNKSIPQVLAILLH